MERRLFTKAVGVSLLGAFAGCTSLSSDSDEDETEENDDDTLDTENSESNESDKDEQDDEPEEEDSEEQNEESEDGDDQNERDEHGEDTVNESDEQGNTSDKQDEDTGNGSDEQDDALAADEIAGEISMESELEDVLEVVNHEFGWESGRGSHLCNIHFEVRSTSDEYQYWIDAIGNLVDENGASLSGDITQFGLDPQDEQTHTLNLDQCTDAMGYQIDFEIRGISELSSQD
ncbi:hypothetical protein [Natronococcus wangiae]|uniref:hypothetical protein n=1 Tax=Natronococcus wangiae TaxID=3068275 RepID=UPI00273E1894|nr:hypothetical protein [Natronococcus sp. AD5]